MDTRVDMAVVLNGLFRVYLFPKISLFGLILSCLRIIIMFSNLAETAYLYALNISMPAAAASTNRTDTFWFAAERSDVCIS